MAEGGFALHEPYHRLDPDQAALLGELPTERFSRERVTTHRALRHTDHAPSNERPSGEYPLGARNEAQFHAETLNAYLARVPGQESLQTETQLFAYIEYANEQLAHTATQLAGIETRLAEMRTKITPYELRLQRTHDELEALYRDISIDEEGRADFGIDAIEQEAKRLTQSRIQRDPQSTSLPHPEHRISYVARAYHALRQQGSPREQRHAERMLEQYAHKTSAIRIREAYARSLESLIAPDIAAIAALERRQQGLFRLRERLIDQRRRDEKALLTKGNGAKAAYDKKISTLSHEQRAYYYAIEEAYHQTLTQKHITDLGSEPMKTFAKLARDYAQRGMDALKPLRPYISPDISLESLALQLGKLFK